MTLFYNTYTYGNPRGFCDFLRTVFCNFCDAPNGTYDVFFDKGPLSKCFKNNKIVAEKLELCDQNVAENVNTFLKHNEVIDYKKRFINFLEDRTSPYVNELLYKYTKKYGNDFIAIHARCGDQYISPFKNPDNRIKEHDALKKLLVLKEDLGPDFKKCLLFTDSMKLKKLVSENQELYNLKMFEHEPVHCAYNYLKGDLNEYSYVPTISEWFFMSNAKSIYAVASYNDKLNRLSSFSLMSSYIYDIPFYYVTHDNRILEGFTDDKLFF